MLLVIAFSTEILWSKAFIYLKYDNIIAHNLKSKNQILIELNENSLQKIIHKYQSIVAIILFKINFFLVCMKGIVNERISNETISVDDETILT